MAQSSAAIGAKAAPVQRANFRRGEALIALCQAKDARTFSVRAARLYGFGVALSYAIAMLIAREPERPATVQSLLLDALTSLSWVVGILSAFAATRTVQTSDEREGIAALARQRGYAGSALRSARYFATARRVTKFTAIPGLILVLVLLSRIDRAALIPWGVFLALGVLAYSSLLGATIGLLSHAATELMPKHPRWLLLAIIFVPYLAAKVWPHTPSIPSAFGWALEQIDELGARLR